MNGKQIKEYFKDCYLCYGKHLSKISSYKFDFQKQYPNIKDDILYRVFINSSSCNIFDNETDNKIHFFGYTKQKPKWAKD